MIAATKLIAMNAPIRNSTHFQYTVVARGFQFDARNNRLKMTGVNTTQYDHPNTSDTAP